VGSQDLFTFQPISQGEIDHILQPAPKHNDYLLVVPKDDWSVGVNAFQAVGGQPVPEPSTVIVLALGTLVAAARAIRRRV
jgi:hypothetical protein